MDNNSCPTEEEYYEPQVSLRDRVAKFNNIASSHVQKQALNPFSTDKDVGSLAKRRFSKEEYGRPEKGSKSETRGLKATLEISKEMLQLCEVIDKSAEHVCQPGNRKVISFGDLFSIYVSISNKLVGILLRARKQKFVDFEGEVLFQRRDDDVPIILMKPIEEIRTVLTEKINATRTQLLQNEPESLLDEEDRQQD